MNQPDDLLTIADVALIVRAPVSTVRRGHVVPRLSKITVQSFYDDWSSRQVWAFGTRTAMDLALRSSDLGTYQLGRVGHSHVEQWVKGMAANRSPPGRSRPATTRRRRGRR